MIAIIIAPRLMPRPPALPAVSVAVADLTPTPPAAGATSTEHLAVVAP